MAQTTEDRVIIWSAEQKNHVRELFAAGYSAERIGVALFDDRMMKDAVHGLIRRLGLKSRNVVKVKHRIPMNFVRHGYGQRLDADWKARLREIPPDTRNLTQIMMGDPIGGGRS